ncbi:MAG: glycosyl hydrolase family 65 protein [Kiritimatiellales bacterium]|jgi:hypothetical protein
MKRWLFLAMIAGLFTPGYAVEYTRQISVSARYAFRDDYLYYLFDLQDGRIFASAPGKPGFTAMLADIPTATDSSPVKFMAVSLSGRQSKWLPAESTRIQMDSAMKGLYEPLPVNEEPLLQSPKADVPYQTASISLHFSRIKSVSWFIVSKAEGAPFPDQFAVEYTMDRGATWHEIPSACFAHFPDPGKNEVWIPLRGIVANGLRVISEKPPQTADGGYQLVLGAARALGSDRLRFEADGAPDVEIAAWNNLWLVYAEAANEIQESFTPKWPANRPYSGGLAVTLAAEWAEWNAKKLCWNRSPLLDDFRTAVSQYFVNEEGYVYVAAGLNEEKHLNHNRHYVTNPSFIAGVSYYILMTGDTGFLKIADQQNGETVASKMERALRFLLEDCGGKTGLVTLHDPATDGTPASFGNNYWDVFLFGYKSAYMNMLFYHALERYAELLDFTGEPDKASEYRELMSLTKKQFNETFWDESKGRYIGWICKEGKKHDFGFPFVNLPAIRYGLADREQAEQIFDWLDGRRIIPSDTSTGNDIYHYRMAPRANTLAAEADPAYWKSIGGYLKPVKGGTAEYGQNIQNGGFIFYVSYYDLLARLLFAGRTSAYNRTQVILDEFNTDQLRRQNISRDGIGTDCGVIREFPESGLVPYFFISGIMGIEPVGKGLRFNPALPDGWQTARICRFSFRGEMLDILVDRHAETLSVKTGEQGIQLIVPNEKQTLFDSGSFIK